MVFHPVVIHITHQQEMNATLRASAVHDGITEDLHGAAKGDLRSRSVVSPRRSDGGKHGFHDG